MGRVRSTSAAVYSQILGDGLLSKTRWVAYDLLYELGPLTGSEMDHEGIARGLTPAHRPSLHKRLSELEARGAVVCLSPRMCRVTGREAFEWDVTDALPHEPAARPKRPSRPSKAEFKAAVENLRVLYKADLHWTPELTKTARWLASLGDS